MRVKADWLDLKIREYDDGQFEAYEALTDERCAGTLTEVLEFARSLLEETNFTVAKAEGKG